MLTTPQAAPSLRPGEEPLCVDAVASQALLRPDAPALVCGGRTLSYRGLDRRSHAIAGCLGDCCHGSAAPIGLLLPRNFDMVAAALAAWKIGAAYVPLDPASPPERLAFIAADAQIPLIVTDEAHAAQLELCSANVFLLEESSTLPQPPSIPPVAGELAYIIYTSGSTGAPKGVEITHGSLANLIAWHINEFQVTDSDRASHVAGLGFDAAVWELWPYLASGACVYLADEVTRLSPELLRDWLVAQDITISFVPTALAERMLFLEWPRNTALRLLLTGGDRLHHHPPAGLPFKLVNNYGPTECTVVATSGVVHPGGSNLPAIGAPISGTEIYLLDDRGQPAASGAPGEIHIAGVSLARGYRNSPALTAQKFVPNPFSGDPRSRLYKTGDLARWLPDGRLEFMGRIDDQIKIRGYRIEPSEIVAALNRQPGILDSLALAREDGPGDKRLIAYLLVSADFATGHSDLRDRLRASLPEYMLPAAFVRVDAFPLTPHGKIDFSALPAPGPDNALSDPAPAAARTETEQKVTEIVAALLEIDDVALDDNFFMLGGHSLLGTQLIARLRKHFGVQIGLRSLFAAPTVAGLAAEIDRLAGAPRAVGVERTCAEAS